MQPEEFPTPWQRKTLWAAITTFAVVAIGSISVGLIWLAAQVFRFLQPILVPFAVAAVIAYLLEPVVSKLVRWGSSRVLAVIFVFCVATVTFVGVSLWVVPTMWAQSINFAHKVPRYTTELQKRVITLSEEVRKRYGVTMLPPVSVKASPEAAATTGTSPVGPPAPASGPTSPSGVVTADAVTSAPPDSVFDLQQIFSGDWLQGMLQDSGKKLLQLTRDSLGGFFGVLGFLISLVIVPIYLFYFLLEAPSIAQNWSDYLPLRASAFKDEVVSVLNEINGYLIAFFRGQLVVSLINGAVTGIGLGVVRLEFGLLIGVALCFLGIIPYLGITMCWVVALVLSFVQGGSWLVPDHPFWLFPLVVSAIFFVVQWLDGLFVTPKIVGESVGLHPMTVIVSVFIWSLLMGGLLGAILAVPMTATIKVLLRRYVWERRFRPPGGALGARENAPAAALPVIAVP